MFRNLTEDATIEIYFETFANTGAPVAPSSAFTTSDFAIYKNGSATAKATTNGLTVTSPFNSETGCHLLVIDTSNDTGDTGFWTTGARYQVKFNTAKTVGSVSIDGVSVPRGSFGIQSEYEGANVTAWRGSTVNTLTSGRVDAIVGAYASGQAPLQPTTAGRTLDVTATGAAGIDWANIENPTATNQFSGSYIALQNNQNVNLNDGAITASKFAANAITASAIADGAIDTATFAAGTTLPRVTLVDTSTALTNLPTIPTNWLTAAGLAADAATEIGAAVLSALGTGTWATAIPWNAAWDTEVQSECADALNAYDPPTKAELDTAVTGLATSTNVTDAVTLIKGADNDTLKTLSDQMDGLSTGTGTGARTVTITVNDGADVLQNARVRLTEGANTYTGLTNVSGVVTFNLDDATYTVGITKSGYSYSGTTLVVDGTETRTYSMTVISVTPPDDPALCAVTFHVYDQYGADMASQPVDITFVKWETTATDTPPVLSVPPVQTTNNDGVVSVNLFREATYKIVYGNAPYTRRVDVTIPDAGTYTVEI